MLDVAFVSCAGCQHDPKHYQQIHTGELGISCSDPMDGPILQGIANSYNLSCLQPIPAVLEIPSKEHPYDPNQDSILSRVKGMFGADETGAAN